jgi:hypothetical protein
VGRDTRKVAFGPYPGPRVSPGCSSSAVSAVVAGLGCGGGAAAYVSTTGTSAKELHERCAALAWARASISSADHPDSWPTTLDATLHSTLLGLYPLPPHRGTDSPPSDFLRLATSIQLYDPNPPPVAGPSASAGAASHPSSGGGGLINIARPSQPTNILAFSTARRTLRLLPVHARRPRQQLNSSTKADNASGMRALTNSSPSTQQKSPRMMMHDELAALLPLEVYLALYSAAGMGPERRSKFHKACKDFTVTGVLDNTTSAAFGHQTRLALPEDQHFDAFRRGRALAGAGRSAPTCPAAFSEQVAREKSGFSKFSWASAPCKPSGPPSSWPSKATTRSPAPRLTICGPLSPSR